MAAVVQEGGGSTSASIQTGITNTVKKTSTSSGLKSNVTSKTTGVSGASLTPIYNRLNETSLNRPMSANTFSDWSIEAGDTVTVKRDGNSYESQVHSTSLTWKGAPQIEMNSTGNEERDAVSKIKKQKYARSGSGSRIAGNQYNYEMNQEHLMYEVFNKDGKMSHFEVNLDGLHHEVMDPDGRVSILVNDVDGLHHTVKNAEGRVSILENTAKGFKTRIEKVVDDKGNILAAEISTAINEDGSQAYIEADHIKLKGNVILDGVMSVGAGSNIMFSGNILARANGGKGGGVSGNAFAVNPGGYIQFGGYSNLKMTGADFAKTIKTAAVSSNTLTLTRWDGTSVNFSKATAQEDGGWSGSTLKILATQTNGNTKTAVSTYDVQFGGSYSSKRTTLEVNANGSPSIYSGSIVDIPIKVSSLTGVSPVTRYTKNISVGMSGLLQSDTFRTNGTKTPDRGYIGFSSVTIDVPTGGTIDIPTSQIYTTSGYPQGVKLNVLRNKFIQAQNDGDYVCFRVDCGDSSKWYYMEP